MSGFWGGTASCIFRFLGREDGGDKRAQAHARGDV